MGRNLAFPGGFGGGNNGPNPKDAMCSLPWMEKAKICQSRRRRAVSSGMSVGFGPVVVPEDQQLANERPSGNGLFFKLDSSLSISASYFVYLRFGRLSETCEKPLIKPKLFLMFLAIRPKSLPMKSMRNSRQKLPVRRSKSSKWRYFKKSKFFIIFYQKRLEYECF